MPAYKCKCGKWISYGDIPCKDEWVFLSDEEFDELSEATPQDIYRKMRSFLKCPACARLWFFWQGFQEEPEEFVRAAFKEQTGSAGS
jgi:uncharacterized protein with PIN domain